MICLLACVFSSTNALPLSVPLLQVDNQPLAYSCFENDYWQTESQMLFLLFLSQLERRFAHVFVLSRL